MLNLAKTVRYSLLQLAKALLRPWKNRGKKSKNLGPRLNTFFYIITGMYKVEHSPAGGGINSKVY